MSSIELQPNAKSLVLSMRSIGYSFNNAIADIVDNSIAANATQINIQCDWAGYEPTLEIKDNGFGMNYDQLEEAMRLGSKSPVEERAKTDLGRFGLGLKTASFSQCKKLTVITKKEEQTFNNADESFSMGIWESTQANIPSDWPYDEFMYVIEGQILMTDQDGNTYEINPGEGIIVPTGWKGNFSVPEGVSKIWAIYDPS